MPALLLGALFLAWLVFENAGSDAPSADELLGPPQSDEEFSALIEDLANSGSHPSPLRVRYGGQEWGAYPLSLQPHGKWAVRLSDGRQVLIAPSDVIARRA